MVDAFVQLDGKDLYVIHRAPLEDMALTVTRCADVGMVPRVADSTVRVNAQLVGKVNSVI